MGVCKVGSASFITAPGEANLGHISSSANTMEPSTDYLLNCSTDRGDPNAFELGLRH